MPAAERVFLGSDPRPLRRAAAWLLDACQSPIDLGDALVAVPGARAGRTLLTELANEVRARGMAGFLPPRVLTIGRLVDELVRPELPVADRLTRTVAWERALSDVDPQVFWRIARRRPAVDDRAAWWRLADDVRAAHAELAVERIDFAGAAERIEAEAAARAIPEAEVRRFRALGEVQRRWRALLAEAGLADPHEGRRAAIDAGRVDAGARVVLVGVVELNGLARGALAALERPPSALVLAPESMASSFTDLGALQPDERWIDRPIDLPLERWRVVGGPDDQARMAVAECARRQAAGALSAADEVVVGVPDREVVPYLVRRFEGHGVRARDAAGTPIERTAPARLLQGLADFARARSFERLAALLRHADLERVVAAGLDHEPLARLDEYRAQHLPRAAATPIAADVAAAARPQSAGPGERPREPKADIAPRAEAVDALLGALGAGASAPLAEHARSIRGLLERVYADHPLLANDADAAAGEPARVLGAALDALLRAADAVAALPPALTGDATPTSALELVLRAAAAGGAVPPAPAAADEPTVELLGWLDLALDAAPHVVVTGFNEGSVPSKGGDDALLPARLRELFGLATDATRHAYDAYALTLLAARGDGVTLISGRTARQGDPLFPSRLAFARPEEEVVARVQHALSPEHFAPLEPPAADASLELPPFVVPTPDADEFSVTWFSAYIESPARFHTSRQRRLEPVDDRQGELDALVFGSIAHDVLEAFGNSELRSADAPEAIAEFLEKALRRARRRHFPESVLAAAELQLDQLESRLRSFAIEQSRQSRAGWRIEHVEWEPPTDKEGGTAGKRCVRFPMPGSQPDAWLVGKIDRIDRKGDRWRILDYKTSNKADSPEQKHIFRGKNRKADTIDADAWKDLQLPLYVHLAREGLGLEGPIELGYFTLPGDGDPATVQTVTWDERVIATGIERAQRIIAEVRAGDRLAEVGRATHFADIENELFGVGLVVEPDAGGDDEGGDE